MSSARTNELSTPALHGCMAALLVAMLSSDWAHAQAFPSKPVRWIVPTAPGAVVDTTLRALVQEMEKTLGQPGVVENRAGGGGAVGVGAAAKSAPDGYTVVLGFPSSMVTLPMLQKDLPYDPWRELAPVSLLFNAPFYLSTRANSSFKSLKDLIDAAKARPGQVTIGHGAIGGVPHLAVELLREVAGVEFNQVFYKGDAGAVVDFLGGRLDLVSANAAAFQSQLKDGSVRMLFQFGERRSQSLPNVPTASEQGYPKVVGASWVGVSAPTGTPGAAINRLSEAIAAAVAAGPVRERLAQFGLDGAGSTAAAYGEFLRGEQEKWGPIVKRLNLKID